MTVVRKPLSELRRPDRNVRMHTDKQLKDFRRSVEMFGQIRPIVVDMRPWSRWARLRRTAM